MNKFKRWILILTALTVFVVVNVESLRATSLIHAGRNSKLANSTKSTTNTTTASPTEASSNNSIREILDELPDDDDLVDANGTKIVLTGIPQIDYVWDPNLPRELNGFNLSTYPFLDSMPADEDIGFDCEDKINGFYASIKFGCQLYHHCLYGVRSDFICANFTAFDQKTFICHFVSEVDCKNSYKYWSRNDDLYKATTVKSSETSSTLMPLFDRGFYNRTRNSFLNGGSISSSSSSSQNNNNSPQNGDAGQQQQPLSNSNNNNNNNNAPATSNNSNRNGNNNNDFANGGVTRPQRPMRRPPYRRRRPPVDYYYYDDEEYEDDFYDERGRRRNRPRNRRPVYDDYDNRRPDNRRPYYDDFDDYEYDRRPMRNRNRPESRNSSGGGDERRRYEDRRASGDRRRPFDDDRRPPNDERRRNADRRPSSQDDRRFSNEERRFSDDRRNANTNNNDEDKYVRRNPLADDKRKPLEERKQQQQQQQQNTEESISDEKLTKPAASSSSIFDRARPPPKINRPVPLSEKNKFSYKADSKGKENINDDAYPVYDDEYDDVSPSSTTTTTTIKSTTVSSTPKAFSFPKLKPVVSSAAAKTTTTTTTVSDIEYYDDEYYDTATPTLKPIEISSIKPKDERASLFNSRVRNENFAQSTTTTTQSTTTTAASSPDSFRLNRYKNDNSRENVQQSNLHSFIDPLSTTKKPLSSIISFGSKNNNNNNNDSNNSKKYANKQTVFEHSVTQETPPLQKVSTQSYFQNLYNNRHLEKQEIEASVEEDKEQKPVVRVVKRPFLPSRGGNPYKARGLQPVGALADQGKSAEDHQGIDERRQRPEIHKITLEDLYNEEYDVDLNDALNPMLKPLTSSRNVNSFSSQSSVDVNDKDRYKSESQKVIHKADHYVSSHIPSSSSSASSTTTAQPEYYDDELEYTYADDVA